MALVIMAASQVMAQDSTSRADSARIKPHVDEPFHSHGFGVTGGIHLGAPAILSLSSGVKLGLGDRLPGAVYATVEPGFLALRYGVGYQLHNERVDRLGLAIRALRLTGWRDALGIARGVQYSGGEATVHWESSVGIRMGVLTGRRGNGSRVMLATIDFGLGY
jgi:hypothetical protein